DGVSLCLYNNMFITLALSQNKLMSNKNFRDFFDNTMTNYWDNLFILKLLEANTKFQIDMGNDGLRQLKARIGDLEHKQKLLDEAGRTRRVQEEQVEAVKEAARVSAKNQQEHNANIEEYARKQVEIQDKIKESQKRTEEYAQEQAWAAQDAARYAEKSADEAARTRRHITGEWF
ncbi:MAG: hypothetical protein RL154_1423, partial [Pseudomonadota bacterium]